MGRPKNLKQLWPGLRRIAKHLAPLIRKEWRLMLFSLFGLFAGIGFRLLDPWPLKFVFDRVIQVGEHAKESNIPWINNMDSLTLLTLAATTVIVIAILRGVVDYFSTVGFSQVGHRILIQVRNRLYRHLQNLSLSFHSKARGGDLTIRLTSDVNMLKDAAVVAVVPLVANLLIMVAMVLFMFWLNWKLALLAVCPIPFLWLRTVKLSGKIHEVARKQRQREGALAATAAESMAAIQELKAFSLQNLFAGRFFNQSQLSNKDDVKGTRLSAGLQRTVDVNIAIATALVLWYGARLVIQNVLTPGDLLVFLTYLKRAFNPLQDFAKYTARLAKATAAGERVVDLLDREPDVVDLPDSLNAPRFEGKVQFSNITFAYEPGHPVLENVSLSVNAGERVALVGPSGIGKSTLVSLLLRLYEQQEGQISIDDVDIRKYVSDSIRTQMSVVLQDSILFATTIRENISYGALDCSQQEIEAAARLANAHDFILALPQGYETTIGERGVTLSRGQRQRIAIARAAVRNAAIIILDEPTAALDEENERAVTEALLRLTSQRTTFVITHNFQLAAAAQKIVYLKAGKIIEYGSHSELMQAKGDYAMLYQMQTSALSDLKEELHAQNS